MTFCPFDHLHKLNIVNQEGDGTEGMPSSNTHWV